MQRISTRNLVTQAMLIALSIILVLLIRIPIFPSAPFLEYDMADLPILIGTFMFGPTAGLLLTAIVSVLQWLIVSQASGWVGAVMHFLATGAFVLIAGSLYKAKKTDKSLILGLSLGATSMILMMIPLNIVFSSYYYMGLPLYDSFNSLITVLSALPQGFGAILTLLIASGIIVFLVERIFKKSKTITMKILAFPIALAVIFLLIVPVNLFLGAYTVPNEAQGVIDMILPIFVPFNAIKAFGNGLLTYLLFSKLIPILSKKKPLQNKAI
ncbi:MAG: ECF transporter S component [Clostridia bacterium]